jgi:hypothetical protein
LIFIPQVENPDLEHLKTGDMLSAAEGLGQKKRTAAETATVLQ